MRGLLLPPALRLLPWRQTRRCQLTVALATDCWRCFSTPPIEAEELGHLCIPGEGRGGLRVFFLLDRRWMVAQRMLQGSGKRSPSGSRCRRRRMHSSGAAHAVSPPWWGRPVRSELRVGGRLEVQDTSGPQVLTTLAASSPLCPEKWFGGISRT